jgi:hypothetical protein
MFGQNRDVPVGVEAVVADDGLDVYLDFALSCFVQLLHGRVRAVDVSLVVLVVMEGHYLLGDVRFEGVVCVR